MIVRRHGATLDWDHLAREASVRRLGLPLVDALSYIHDAFGVAVPPRALHSLRSIPARPLTRLLHRVRTGRQGSYLFTAERLGHRLASASISTPGSQSRQFHEVCRDRQKASPPVAVALRAGAVGGSLRSAAVPRELTRHLRQLAHVAVSRDSRFGPRAYRRPSRGRAAGGYVYRFLGNFFLRHNRAGILRILHCGCS